MLCPFHLINCCKLCILFPSLCVLYFPGHRPVFFFNDAGAPAYPPGSAYRRLKVEKNWTVKYKIHCFYPLYCCSSLLWGLVFSSVWTIIDNCPDDNFCNDIVSNKMYDVFLYNPNQIISKPSVRVWTLETIIA